MTPSRPPPHTHTHPTPYLGGCEEDLSKKTAPDGTNKQTNKQIHGHGDSRTDPAQRAQSVTVKIATLRWQLCVKHMNVPKKLHNSGEISIWQQLWQEGGGEGQPGHQRDTGTLDTQQEAREALTYSNDTESRDMFGQV